MEKIEWSDDLSIGYGLFDEQHKRLVSLINDIGVACDEGKLDRVAMYTRELLNHAYQHFEYEERFMLQYGFPAYDSHKALHSDFIDKARDISNMMPDRLYGFLRIWFVHHIKEEDTRYRSFIEEQRLTKEIT